MLECSNSFLEDKKQPDFWTVRKVTLIFQPIAKICRIVATNNLQSICMQHAILQGSGYHIPYMEVISCCFVSQSWRKWLSVYTIRSPLSDLVSGSSNMAQAREWVEAVCNTASRQCSCEWPDKHKCTSKQLALFPGPRPAFQPLWCKMERAWHITSCEHDMITKCQEWEVTFCVLCNQLTWSCTT